MIVNIPLDFYSVKTKSWNTLLLESGYFEVHELIAEHEIIEILKKHPHLIAEWLKWSDNQRCTPLQPGILRKIQTVNVL